MLVYVGVLVIFCFFFLDRGKGVFRGKEVPFEHVDPI